MPVKTTPRYPHWQTDHPDTTMPPHFWTTRGWSDIWKRTTDRWGHSWTTNPTGSPGGQGPVPIQYCDFDHMCNLKPKMNPNAELFITTAKTLKNKHIQGPSFDRTTGTKNGKFIIFYVLKI